MNLKKLFFGLLTILILFAPAATAAKTCTTYFTGVGCPHCAKADPVVLEDYPQDFNSLVVIEYEIYQKQSNAPLLYNFNSNYNSGLGVPALIFGEDNSLVGDRPILQKGEKSVSDHEGNACPTSIGKIKFDSLDLSKLEGYPKIWANKRVILGKPDNSSSSEVLKSLLFEENLVEELEKMNKTSKSPSSVPLSGKSVNFDNAVQIDGATLQWNGKGLEKQGNGTSATRPQGDYSRISPDLTLPKIVGLAAVDAVNPCALAVLSLMLISIITYNPKEKRNILLAGLAFVASVFVMYLFYGLVIVKSFQLIQALTSVRVMLYKALGVLAIVLGILNLKDFVHYKPGGFGTEMPKFLRPKVKKIISGITSPKGAFLVGAFVTLFLLPCTIGPYVIAGGVLSTLGLLKTLPALLLYNAIFVLPMLAITIIVYMGMSSIEDVSEWRENNIRYLHLIAGAIILGLGIAMVLGLV